MKEILVSENCTLEWLNNKITAPLKSEVYTFECLTIYLSHPCNFGSCVPLPTPDVLGHRFYQKAAVRIQSMVLKLGATLLKSGSSKESRLLVLIYVPLAPITS